MVNNTSNTSNKAFGKGIFSIANAGAAAKEAPIILPELDSDISNT